LGMDEIDITLALVENETFGTTKKKKKKKKKKKRTNDHLSGGDQCVKKTNMLERRLSGRHLSPGGRSARKSILGEATQLGKRKPDDHDCVNIEIAAEDRRLRATAKGKQ